MDPFRRLRAGRHDGTFAVTRTVTDSIAVVGAGDKLLDTYDAERRPIGELTVAQAHARYIRRGGRSSGHGRGAPRTSRGAGPAG